MLATLFWLNLGATSPPTEPVAAGGRLRPHYGLVSEPLSRDAPKAKPKPADSDYYEKLTDYTGEASREGGAKALIARIEQDARDKATADAAAKRDALRAKQAKAATLAADMKRAAEIKAAADTALLADDDELLVMLLIGDAI